MKKDPILYVLHIIECIERIEGFTENNHDSFVHDRKTYDAVIRNLQIIGKKLA